jgi:hypothetical protein
VTSQGIDGACADAVPDSAVVDKANWVAIQWEHCGLAEECTGWVKKWRSTTP